MTSEERREMISEDNELSAMMGKGSEMGYVPDWKLIVRDQPALYVQDEGPQVDEDAVAEYYKPVVNYGVPRELIQSVKNAALPVALAIFFWSMRMSGNASTALSLGVIIPALSIAAAGAVAPWIGGSHV